MLIHFANQVPWNNSGTLYINDKPKIHEGINGGILDVQLDFKKGTGKYSCPSSMFWNPGNGDFIDVTCASKRKLRCVVTTWTQNWHICTGEVAILCYVEEYDEYIKQLK